MIRKCVVLALLVAAFAGVAGAVECRLTNFGVSCDRNKFVVTWSYDNTCEDPPTFKIEYRCCPNGSWQTAVDGAVGNSYTFAPAGSCVLNEYYIRLTIQCQGCDCTGPMCAIETSTCLSCP